MARKRNTWLDKNRDDKYYKKAKAQNYRARSIFKLEELDNKFKVFKFKGKNATRILDIGCAPGSWLQWLSKKQMNITPNANQTNRTINSEQNTATKNNQADAQKKLLVGIDLTTIQPIQDVIFHRGNILDDEFLEELVSLYPSGFQVIISDAGVKTIGNQDTDHARQMGLAERVIEFVEKLLLPGGNCVIKLFEGVDAQSFLKENQQRFGNARLSKPQASRKESKEIYFIGRDWIA